MKMYFISGLGADERVFRNIVLPHEYEAVHLPWIEPLLQETLEDYAARMSEKINTNENFSLIGLSFGGMIATEISKIISPQQIVLISSVSSFKHLPPYYHWLGKMGLHKILPMKSLKNASMFKRFFSLESAEDKAVIRSMIHDCDVRFLKWAIGAILNWTNKTYPANLIHLHGGRDAILPIRYTKPTRIVTKGGHMMVMNKAVEINKILSEELILL